MSKIIFFDTETTGNTEKDFLCQIAYKSDNDSFVGLYKPSIKVPPEASAVHHITNKMLEKLYERLKKKLIEQEKINEEEAIQKMIEISSHPSLFTSIRFGKYSGKKIEEIKKVDRGYLEWLLAQKIESDQIDEDWIYTLKHYLGK